MKPNILYLHSHDTGRYIQPYGYAVPTPNLQHLATEGILFRKAFAVSPTCSPSRAALLTGKYPHEVGMLGLSHRGFGMHDYQEHLVNLLRPAGYRSVLAGVQHVARHPDVIGYGTILPTDSNMANDVAPAAARFLRDAPPGQPFFLDVGFQETHRPFPDPDPRDDPRYVMPPVPLPDTPETRADMAAYRTIARDLDDGVGTVLDALEDSGLAESTLVICTTDHGVAFPHMKCTLTDHGLGVMAILRGPGGFSGGGVVDAMVTHLDIVPTLCELAGLEPPSNLRGRSLLPLVHGELDHLHDVVYAEVNHHVEHQPQRSVRTQRYKYIRSFRQLERRIAAHTDDSPTKSYLEGQDWAAQPRYSEELYDLVFDPHETNNLAGDETHAELLRDMRSLLRHWQHETRDPLREGQAPR